ncbi:hypothetical protein RO3G_02457 [Rhizopus delemar RA 99-880]|uniref:Uncharacterized protein n=1 Tax=Rhizopus delemar (strain RA 99-880 / ATCC MYA-4621 / FGSC 9543 / NRRL 43880) TaxID=246409 RepID=I1BNH3_RHIO9|nr:hypothetical protein RO3G_02457 [Rhizopus delemar RA 99-880]|eukprot:EIE77753.1 hypothetical protein RO3G_02457 [Rhizopus delemar RA 99-880]
MTNKQASDQYFLKRICLAKAIKSMDEIGKDSWEKSVIFNQSFVKEILSHKQQNTSSLLSLCSPYVTTNL